MLMAGLGLGWRLGDHLCVEYGIVEGFYGEPGGVLLISPKRLRLSCWLSVLCTIAAGVITCTYSKASH